MRFRPLDRVRVVATATRGPGDLLGAAHDLDNDAAWEALLGPEWLAALAERALDRDHPRTAWGVGRRGWCALPGRVAQADAVDLGVAAARAALEEAGLRPDDLDVIVFATSTPTRPTASDAHRVAKALGTRAASWDVRSGGAAGLLGWHQAGLAVDQGARAALLVAAEAISPWIDPEDVALALLYGDAAAAVVLAPGDGALRSLSAGHATVPGRAFTVPASLPPRPGERLVASRPDATYQQGLRAVWADARAALLDGLAGRAADALLPYAVTRQQVLELADGVPTRRVVDVLPEWGCVGAASPLVALDRWRRTGGSGLVASAAVGGGVSWAALTWEQG
ncbi:MAG: hypothetical protein H6738_05580 [Alphaproteobacteria bacterium]|nr:hypothetical protein [Alphaproteobacteria bacterium]MCB9696239.1 hypothetical protein [Alphaproteobacteria bacterium]